MRSFRKVQFAVLALVATFFITPMSVRASSPSGGVLNQESGPVNWYGEFVISVSPVFAVTDGCLRGKDPSCDYFELSVDAPLGEPIHVTIAASHSADDLDLYVLDEFANEIARSNKSSGYESTVFAHRGGMRNYTIAVAPWEAVVGSTYSGTVSLSKLNPFPEVECSEFVPDSDPLLNPDDGGNVDLNVLVLMDGPRAEENAVSIFNDAAKAYEPLGITLKPTYTAVSFSSYYSEADGLQLLRSAKDFVGGQRPAGIDVVYVLSSKPIFYNNFGTSGLNDCIGGVQHPHRAFAAGEVDDGEDPNYFPDDPPNFKFNVKLSAKTAAHEIGHLLGGQHQYANCIEEAPTALEDLSHLTVGGQPCTLMFQEVYYNSINFSRLNGAIIRDRAWKYARP